MYESVRVEQAGPTTVSRFAATLARVGFEGMVVRNRQGSLLEYDPAAIADRYGIDVVPAIEIDTRDMSVASGSIGHRREQATVLLLRGRTPEMNRFGAESPRLDVVADPMGGDGDLNHVIVNAAEANGVALEVNLGPVLRQSGGARVQALRGLRKLRELIEAADAPFVVSASPATHLQVRAPRELVAVGETIGFDREQLRTGLETWATIAARNRGREDPGYVAPGVTVDMGTEDGPDDENGDLPAGTEGG